MFMRLPVDTRAQMETAEYYNTLEWYENESLCRAQLRKVDMELFAPWEQKLTAQIDAEGYVEHQVRLDVALRTVQAARTALREAAGGEG